MTISIIIPAYNEASLLVGTLNHILEDDVLLNCEIIVVCNGCSDNSAEIINSFAANNSETLDRKSIDLKLLNENKPSKTNALNVGISASIFNIKVLLDADIKVSGHCIKALVDALDTKGLMAMSPRVIFDTARSSNLVKKYYKVEQHSKYNQELRLSNVIALSEQGIILLGQFPDVIADDEYLRRQFNNKQYSVLSSESFIFEAPKDLKNLINVLSRVERGNLQLNQLGVCAKEATRGKMQNNHFIDKVVFSSVKLVAKVLARFQYYFGDKTKWQRDLSTRGQL